MSLPYPQGDDPWIHQFTLQREDPHLSHWVARLTGGKLRNDLVEADQFLYRLAGPRIQARRQPHPSFPLGFAMAELFTLWVGLLPLGLTGKGPWCRYFPKHSPFARLRLPFASFVECGKAPECMERPGSSGKSFLDCSFRQHKARTFGEAVLKVSRPCGGGVHFQDLGPEVVIIGEHHMARFQIEDQDSLRKLDFQDLGSGVSRLFKMREWVALAHSLTAWGQFGMAARVREQVERQRRGMR